MLPEPRVLISTDAIARRVDELAQQISRDYAGVDDLLLIGVLRGAFIFLADLARKVSVPHHVDFVALSSYDGAAKDGVRLVLDLRTPVSGRHALIVEDIVDSGHTLAYLIDMLRARNPASIKTCALTVKAERLATEVQVDYIGFRIPDRWVVGYGLDYGDQYRTLPYIGVVDVTP